MSAEIVVKGSTLREVRQAIEARPPVGIDITVRLKAESYPRQPVVGCIVQHEDRTPKEFASPHFAMKYIEKILWDHHNAAKHREREQAEEVRKLVAQAKKDETAKPIKRSK